jgi:hypothetical protein
MDYGLWTMVWIDFGLCSMLLLDLSPGGLLFAIESG